MGPTCTADARRRQNSAYVAASSSPETSRPSDASPAARATAAASSRAPAAREERKPSLPACEGGAVSGRQGEQERLSDPRPVRTAARTRPGGSGAGAGPGQSTAAGRGV
jgi:hypothetical protein